MSKKNPTLKEVWEWYKISRDHFLNCTSEDCEYYYSFAKFIEKHNIEGGE